MKITFPHIGQRIIKTTVAVFLCLLIYYLLGYRGEDVPAEACITAIICMQPFVKDSGEYALNRFAGTLIGCVWGLLFLMLLPSIPWISSHIPLVYALMAVGTMMSLYTAVLLGKNDASSLAAIVFLCIVISYPDIDEPLKQAALRVGDVFIGTTVAILVNVFRLPRKKNEDLVIFARTADLIGSRMEQLDPRVIFKLNKLYQDGAKIGLVSEHAPAFFTMQLTQVKLRVPVIVMDGAAIFDTNTNHFTWKQTIAEDGRALLEETFESMGISYSVYTIHKHKTCIFHVGEITEPERIVYDNMKRSPYRSYLKGEILKEAEIVYYKIIDKKDRIEEIEKDLHKALPERRFRIVKRDQGESPEIKSIYIYDHAAERGHAKAVLMQTLYPQMRSEDVIIKPGKRDDSTALQLLSKIEDTYEPVRFW